MADRIAIHSNCEQSTFSFELLGMLYKNAEIYLAS
jgi:hypothetical protein